MCWESQGNLGTDKKFTGQRLDGTGLYYYNARYYDATIGRFISPDNVVSKPFNPQNLNRYSYCLNNPLKYTDPTGHVNVADDGGGDWDMGTPAPIIYYAPIQSGGIGTGFSDIPELPLDKDEPTGPTFNLPDGPAFNLHGPNERTIDNGPICTRVKTVPAQTHPAPPIKPDSTDPYLNICFDIGMGPGMVIGWMFNKDGGFMYVGAGFMTPGVSLTTGTGGIYTGLNASVSGGLGIGGSMGGLIAPGSQFSPESGVGVGFSLTEYYVWKFLNPTRNK